GERVAREVVGDACERAGQDRAGLVGHRRAHRHLAVDPGGEVSRDLELVHRERRNGALPAVAPVEAERRTRVHPEGVTEHLEQPGAAGAWGPPDPDEVRLELLVVERKAGSGRVGGGRRPQVSYPSSARRSPMISWARLCSSGAMPSRHPPGVAERMIFPEPLRSSGTASNEWARTTLRTRFGPPGRSSQRVKSVR